MTPASPADWAALPMRDGDYQILGEVGRGGMGEILRVADPQFDRVLAVKVLRQDLQDDAGLRGRFLFEAEIQGSLQHPGIPPVHELGRLSDGRLYFAMKLIEGETLAAQLRKRNSPNDDRARLLDVFRQVAEAVAYAHSRGVIHRDLKPSNVMVGAFGEVQVMDWGLSRADGRTRALAVPSPAAPAAAVPHASQESTARPGASDETVADGNTFSQPGVERHTQPGDVLGTPGYMPPEQVRGETNRLDTRADVFSLGAVLCEILTGSRPITGESQDDVLAKSALGNFREAFRKLEESNVDEELVGLCKRCLSADAKDRPGDASDVATAIRAWDEAVQERLQTERTERAAAEVRITEERKRRRVTLGLALVSVLLVVGGAAVAWWYQQEKIAKETAAAINSQNADREINDLLARSEELREKFEFKTAATLLDQAEERTAVLLEPRTLSERIANAKRELDFLSEFDRIRIEKSRTTIGTERKVSGFRREFALGKTGAFANAFRRFGIDIAGTVQVASLADQVSESPIKTHLLAALDDWAYDDKKLRVRILAVARAADPDPLRRRLRDPQIWTDAETLTSLAEQVAAEPLQPPTVLSLARRLIKAKREDAAAKLLRVVAIRHADDFWVQFNTGGLLSDEPLEELEAAVEHFRAAASLRPTSAAAHANLGGVLSKLERAKEAEMALRKAVSLGETDSKAHNNLAAILGETGRLNEAETHVRKALELDPGESAMHANLGVILKKMRRMKEAEAAYREAIRLADDEADASHRAENHALLGRLLLEMGKVPDSEASLKEAIRIDANHLGAHIDLATLYSVMKRQNDALAVFRTAARIAPESPLARTNLAVQLANMGRFTEAEKTYRESLKLDRFSPLL